MSNRIPVGNGKYCYSGPNCKRHSTQTAEQVIQQKSKAETAPPQNLTRGDLDSLIHDVNRVSALNAFDEFKNTELGGEYGSSFVDIDTKDASFIVEAENSHFLHGESIHSGSHVRFNKYGEFLQVEKR